LDNIKVDLGEINKRFQTALYKFRIDYNGGRFQSTAINVGGKYLE
jgi:hypothetical protein